MIALGIPFLLKAVPHEGNGTRYGIAMRIAQVAPRKEQPWSGVLTVVVNLAAALARRGHEVAIWQLHEWDKSYAMHLACLDNAGVSRVLIPFDWWTTRFRTSIRAAADKVDIAHLHGAFNLPNAAAARVLAGPYAFSPHSGYDPVSLRRSRGRKAAYAILLERRMLRRAALQCALTHAEMHQLQDFGARGPLTAIPNGVTPVPARIDRSRFRRQLGLDSATRLAVFAGRLDTFRKGLDILLNAVAQAPDWHLALVGPDQRGEQSNLQELSKNLAISERVTFAGVLYGQQLHEALASANVFALFSRWEGLPMALLEALSCGTPAVVSPQVERLVGVAAAGAGWVASPNTLADLLCALSRVDEHEWIQRKQSAFRLSKRYDWGVVAGQYEAAYEQALLTP